LSHHLDGLARPARTATTVRRATRRTARVVRHRRRLVGDDARRRTGAALLQAVNRGCVTARRDDPEFNPSGEVRIARFVRASVAEVAHSDARTVDALLVDEVVAGIVGAGERDADAL